MITTKLTLDDVRLTAPAVFAINPHPRLSDRYNLFNTGQIIEPMLNDGWFVTRCGQAKAREYNRDYTNHFVALTRDDLVYGDEQIEALVFNSHDGRKKLLYELGVYRGICANGCVWSDETFGKLNLRHLGYDAAQVYEACGKIAEHAPEVAGQIDSWKRIELSAPDRVALAQFGLKLRWPKNPPICAGDLLFIRRYEDEKPTLWNTYNRIQENLMKGGTTYVRSVGKHRTGTTRAVSSISTGLSLNKRLWEGAHLLAEGLALPA